MFVYCSICFGAPVSAYFPIGLLWCFSVLSCPAFVLYCCALVSFSEIYYSALSFDCSGFDLRLLGSVAPPQQSRGHGKNAVGPGERGCTPEMRRGPTPEVVETCFEKHGIFPGDKT